MIKKVVIECVALVCAVTGLGLEAVADYPANAYVQRGLVMQFDAIDNVGTGTHDSTATVWKDLVSANAGAYDMALTTYGSWNDGNALKTTGKGAGTTGPSPAITPKTMEGCFTLDTKSLSSSSVLYSSGLYDSKMVWNIAMLKNGNGVVFGGDVETYEFGNDYSGFHTLCWIRENKEAFQNGTNLTIKSTSAGWGVNYDRKDMQTVGAMGKDLALAVKMHAIRFYDRKLTAEEVALNSNIDQVRFENVDPATLTWPTGYRGREGYGLECAVSVSNNALRGSIEVNGEDFGEFYEAWTAMGAERTATIQAKAKPGYRFVRWEDRWDALTDDQRVSPSITMTGRTDRALVLTAVYTLDLSAQAYQQYGLTMQFDGIDNVGTGTHDPAAAVWKDLVVANEGAYDMALTAHGSWNGNALKTDGVGSGATSTQSPPNTLRTMEVSFDASTSWSGTAYSSGIHANVKRTDTGDTADRMLWHVALFSGSVVFGGNCNQFAVGPDHSGLNTLCWIREVPAGFQNGTNLTMLGVSNGYTSQPARNGKQTIGALGTVEGAAGSGFPGAVKVYAVRHYDRKLSAAEIAFNSNVDKIRFEGADPAMLTWPGGYYRYQEGAGVEYAIKVSADTHGGFTVNGEDGGESYEGWLLLDADEVTITAVPDPGYHFVCWEGEGLSEAERRQLTLSGVNRMQLDIKPVFALGSSDLYVTKGLTMQFDAIDNVGTGTHDLDSTVWKDLVAANTGAYDMAVTTYGSWNDTALETTGAGAGATGPSPRDLTVQAMEGCYTLDTVNRENNLCIYSSGLYGNIAGSNKMIWHVALLSYERGVLFGGNYDYFDAGKDYLGTHTMCWIREDKMVFQNGTNLNPVVNSAGWGANNDRNDLQTVGAMGSENELRCPVKMHAIRFYDRKLTADEIAFNANVDQVRFKDADPAALTWPAEISYNSELERLEVEVTATYDERKGTLSVNGVAVPSGVATAVPYGNGTGVIAFVPSLKGYWLESVDIGEPEKVVAQDQVATVRLFDVRSFTAKIRGGGLILIVQ